MFFGWGRNKHESYIYLQRNLGVLSTVWVPAAMVYFMDTQIWYAIFSTICGAIGGAFSNLGQIQNLWTIRSRFEAFPREFRKNLVPRHGTQSNKSEREDSKNFHTYEFSETWNEFIISLRDEDLISNRERRLLIFPSSMAKGETSFFQWPAFLLANKIHLAINMAARSSVTEGELRNGIKNEEYAYDAVIECYETILNILYGLMDKASDMLVLDQIRSSIEDSVRRGTVVKDFYLDELPYLLPKFEKLLYLLRFSDVFNKSQLVATLQDIMEIITVDIMKNGQGILKDERMDHFVHINLDSIKDRAWNEKCVRLQLLMTTRESAVYVPKNLEARRRIIFFAQSIFMKMPKAPQAHRMMSFSVLTSYFKEDVLYSEDDLWNENEYGISMLFYLRKIYPDEWRNFVERIEISALDDESLKLNTDEISHWASYRGQTLARTVRGMMYYRKALEIQCIQDKADLDKFDSDKILESTRGAKAIADIKFTYVLSCQRYGMLEISKDARERISYMNILNLMTTYPSLRVAYIDEVEHQSGNGMKTTYYSVLVKGGHKCHEEIYRIKLPGKPTDIGEWKPEIQNHAIIFTRGEALQAININQDNYLEEAFKLRNLLEEFESEKRGKNIPTILSIRQHIFTGSVSSLSWFMFNQESSFATIGQRVMANYLRVGFHYGHPDIFDRLFHITRGGISKASKVLNESEGIFSGFNSIMRGGCVKHLEYMQVGKGIDVGMNQISTLEANVASCYGEQTLSRDIYRLGQRFDFYRMLSLYFTTVGFYFSGMVSVLTVYVFLYGRLYLVLRGLEKPILLQKGTHGNIKPLESTLVSQSVFQLGFLLAFPILLEFSVETGFSKALGEFVIMQLHLASAFFTFQLGTRTHYYGRTILHGEANRRTTGREFDAYHVKFAENYRMYSRSHFVKGLELLMLLVLYQVYGSSYHTSSLDRFLSFSIWFLVASWLYAPFIFNPLCFEWQKAVDDWTDWRIWMGNRESFGISGDKSWEVWWKIEQEHLRKTSIHSILLEVILSLRFLMYQFGIVNYLNIARTSQSTLVYALSGMVMLSFLVVLKVDSIRQQGFGTNRQLMLRFLKALVFLGAAFMMSILFIVANLSMSDVFISILGFIPTGWCIILIGQACSPFLKTTMLWNSIVELARAYDSMMGAIVFLPIIILSWFPYLSEWQTRLLFNPAFFRGIQISNILARQKYTGGV